MDDLRSFAEPGQPYKAHRFILGGARHTGLSQVLALSCHNVDRLLCLDDRQCRHQRELAVVYFDCWDVLMPSWRAPSCDAFFHVLRQAELDVEMLGHLRAA